MPSNPGYHENQAFQEGLSNLIEIMIKNSKHNPPYSNPDWTDSSGIDISNPNIDHINDTDFSSNGDPYENGAVIGHVFYELVEANNNWDFQRAARLFLHAIYHMDDGGDGAIDFEDFREGQITALEVGNLPQTDIDQVNTAWEDVGMGPFAQPTSGPTTPPSYVNGSLLSTCWVGGGGYSEHLNIWQDVSGVPTYLVGYSLDGFSYIPSFYSSTSSAQTINRADVWVKVASCQSSGCGSLSNDSYYQQDFCPD